MHKISAAVSLLGLTLLVGTVYFSRQKAIAQATAPTGLIVKASPYSVEETETRFKQILEARGLNVFATVDHTQNASGVGLELRPTRVVIFGNPKLGTPLMQCQQTIAIDLPQKVLIWEDEQGQVQLAYNDPQYLGGRHRLDGCGVEAIKTITGALNNLTNGAISP
ncbi:membrane protein [Leptolyngbya sp. Heron Island J]|uniref:DUF302 domain-containing protein n=1 Tax=Leptolyngbya sp. Heron Island J TaxID=1385935 RepID=UPI0003B99A65|nr:DUF302 domain-containing protein [Leptolyngbya sp. Heron Island J]ESA34092.1 membrane protein [Leptolyngbya sp. Heron Island J]